MNRDEARTAAQGAANASNQPFCIIQCDNGSYTCSPHDSTAVHAGSEVIYPSSASYEANYLIHRAQTLGFRTSEPYQRNLALAAVLIAKKLDNLYELLNNERGNYNGTH